MSQMLELLNNYPIRTRLSLSGTLVVARDIAHAKLQERLDSGQGLPDYIKNHPVYYAGPAKTPQVIIPYLCQTPQAIMAVFMSNSTGNHGRIYVKLHR